MISVLKPSQLAIAAWNLAVWRTTKKIILSISSTTPQNLIKKPNKQTNIEFIKVWQGKYRFVFSKEPTLLYFCSRPQILAPFWPISKGLGLTWIWGFQLPRWRTSPWRGASSSSPWWVQLLWNVNCARGFSLYAHCLDWKSPFCVYIFTFREILFFLFPPFFLAVIFLTCRHYCHSRFGLLFALIQCVMGKKPNPVRKRGEMNCVCPYLKDCIDHVVLSNWMFWTCSECPFFCSSSFMSRWQEEYHKNPGERKSHHGLQF